jgi:nicotinamide mononucleotide transporter
MDTWFALEWSAALLSLAAVACMAARRRAGFPLNILASFIYLLVFRHSGLLGDAALQLWFIVWLTYGWIYWKRRENISHQLIPVKLPARQLLIVLPLWAALSLLLGFYLSKQPQAAFPWADAFCVAGSLIAQVLQSRAVIFNWWMWILIDLVYIPVYLQKELYATSGLYAFFLVLAVLALREWKKAQTQQDPQEVNLKS